MSLACMYTSLLYFFAKHFNDDETDDDGYNGLLQILRSGSRKDSLLFFHSDNIALCVFVLYTYFTTTIPLLSLPDDHHHVDGNGTQWFCFLLLFHSQPMMLCAVTIHIIRCNMHVCINTVYIQKLSVEGSCSWQKN